MHCLGDHLGGRWGIWNSFLDERGYRCCGDWSVRFVKTTAAYIDISISAGTIGMVAYSKRVWFALGGGDKTVIGVLELVGGRVANQGRTLHFICN